MRHANPASASQRDGQAAAGAGHGHLLRDPRWWVAFLLFFGLAASWAFASPLFSVPDEPAHTVKAAAVYRGQLAGRKVNVPDRPGTILRGGWTILVHVPGSYTFKNPTTIPNCYIWNARASASCEATFVDSSQPIAWTTWEGRYPPTYYGLVGWSTLISTGKAGIYLMRILTAALFAALLATAMACAWEAPRSRLLALGVVVAATPTALFLAGGVNPNSLEIAAAICLWSSLGVAAMGTEPTVPRHILGVIAVSGAVLAVTRPASTLWLAVIVVAMLVLAGRERIATLLRQRSVQVTAAIVGVAAVAGGLWTLVENSLGNDEGIDPRGLGLVAAYKHSFARTGVYGREMIGVFGWRTTPSPSFVYWAWIIAIALLVGLALWRGRRRAGFLLLGLLAATLFLPPFIEALNAKDKGFPWQGRYTIPLAAGLPIIGALVLGARRALDGRATARLAAVVVTLVAAGHFVAFYWALRRYAVGSQGRLLFLGHSMWSPPVAAWLLVLAALVCSVGLGVFTYRVVTGDRPLAEGEPSSPVPAPPLAMSRSE